MAPINHPPPFLFLPLLPTSLASLVSLVRAFLPFTPLTFSGPHLDVNASVMACRLASSLRELLRTVARFPQYINA